MEKKYKISEIANMFQIPRTVLIHYDHCGLLKPPFREENNYRYYSTKEVKRLELILALKESGLSLKEIGAYLEKKSEETSLDLLTKQRNEIEKKIQDLSKQKEIIDSRIESLQLFSQIELYDGILHERYPEQNIVKEAIGYGPGMNYSSAINRLKDKVGRQGSLTSKFGICYELVPSETANTYVMKYVFDYLHDSTLEDASIKIPLHDYLRTLHYGDRSKINTSIDKVLEYAHKNKMKIDGEIYYIPLLDFWESMTDEFIGEILFPVTFI